jgi:photosystem II stability/assembly factor-like uncharacterized protein
MRRCGPRTLVAVLSLVAPVQALAAPPAQAAVSRWSSSGPFGGGTPASTGFAMSPSDPRTLYLGTGWAGVFKTSDRGGTWEPLNRGMGRVSVLAVAVDPRSSDIAYAGTQDQGAYKTSDGGKTWAGINQGLPASFNSSVYAIAIDQSSPDTVYASAFRNFKGGVFKSTDGGATWTLLIDLGATMFTIDPLDTQVIYAGAGDHVYESTDGGRSGPRRAKGLAPAR